MIIPHLNSGPPQKTWRLGVSHVKHIVTSSNSDLGTYMATDIIFDLSFGESLHLLDKPDMHFIIESIGSYLHRSYMAMQYPAVFTPGTGNWLSLFKWLLPDLLNRERYAQATKDVAQKRINSKDSRKDCKDIMSFLLEAKDSETGEKLSTAELRSEANLMISAGESIF